MKTKASVRPKKDERSRTRKELAKLRAEVQTLRTAHRLADNLAIERGTRIRILEDKLKAYTDGRVPVVKVTESDVRSPATPVVVVDPPAPVRM